MPTVDRSTTVVAVPAEQLFTDDERAALVGFWLATPASSDAVPVGPGGGFVVEGLGLEAAVQDADEAVAE